jgi:hypothetical protein
MDLVWIIPEKCWGRVTNAFYQYSLVQYENDGLSIEELFDNDDLIDVRELGIEYESETDL